VPFGDVTETRNVVPSGGQSQTRRHPSCRRPLSPQLLASPARSAAGASVGAIHRASCQVLPDRTRV